MKCEYQEAMSAVRMPPGCEARILEALDRRERPGRRHPGRTALLFAAAAALLCGSALAGYRAGVLDLFFPESAGVLEPYVQQPNSVSNGDYRLSVDGVLFDGRSIYAAATIEGLNPQAVEALKSNQVIAESHLADWGQNMVDSLLESGGAGPDTFLFRGMTSSGSCELPAPNASSRAWKVEGQLDAWTPGEPITFWVGFMGRDCAIDIYPELIQPLALTPDRTVSFPEGAGEAVCTEFTLYMTGASGTFRVTEGEVSLRDLLSPAVQITLKDGQVLSGEDLGLLGKSGTLLELEPQMVLQYSWQLETPIDPSQIASVSFNGTVLTP